MTEDFRQSDPDAAAKKPRLLGLKSHWPFIAAGVVILVLGAVLYENSARDSKEAAALAAKCASSRQLATRLAPLVHGEVAALNLNPAAQPLPDLMFNGPDGAKTRLASFDGHLVLFNLWATWCVPCRQEMPSLDTLQGKLGSKAFEIVPVNIDTARLERPKHFLEEIGVKNLKFYADSTADVFQALKQNGKVVGLPTTILVGKDGCEVGTMSGPAKWDSEEAQALIKAAVE